MKYITASILLILFSGFSCSKQLCACDPVLPSFFKAIVVETSNIDCGRTLVMIDPADAQAVRDIGGYDADTYVLDQFPAELNSVSKKVYIKVRKLESNEGFICTMLGISYPQLKLIEAVAR